MEVYFGSDPAWHRFRYQHAVSVVPLRASYAPTTHAIRSRQQISNTLSSVNGKNKLKVSLSDTRVLFLYCPPPFQTIPYPIMTIGVTRDSYFERKYFK